MDPVLIGIIVVALLLIILIIISLRSKQSYSPNSVEFKHAIDSLVDHVRTSEKNLKDEFSTNRKESAETAVALRSELGLQLNQFTQTFAGQLGALTQSNETKLEAIRSTFEEKLLLFQQNLDNNQKESRQALKENLDGFKKELNEALNDYKDRLKDLFSGFEKNQFSSHYCCL